MTTSKTAAVKSPSLCKALKASRPSRAVTTLKPSLDSSVVTSRRIAGSSSATRMRRFSLAASLMSRMTSSSLDGFIALSCFGGKLGREFYRRHHAGMFRDSLSCNVEGGAMIDRGANEWQTQRYINRLAKRKTFNRNHSLIMIARNDTIELSMRGAQENCISRERSPHIYLVIGSTTFNRGKDF